MPQDTPIGLVGVFDDFDHDSIGTAAGDGIVWVNSSDGGTAFAATAAQGGIARSATAATDDHMTELAHNKLMWRVQDGVLGMEARLKVDDIANVALNVGFNDDELDDSNTLPTELSGTTWTSNATTFVGFVFDTDATNDDWHAFWVDDDSDSSTPIADLRFNGVSWKAAAYWTFRVELQDRGAGNQARAVLSIVDDSGRLYQKVLSSTVDRDALLTPHVGLENRSASAHQIDVDYIKVWASRP